MNNAKKNFRRYWCCNWFCRNRCYDGSVHDFQSSIWRKWCFIRNFHSRYISKRFTSDLDSIGRNSRFVLWDHSQNKSVAENHSVTLFFFVVTKSCLTDPRSARQLFLAFSLQRYWPICSVRRSLYGSFFLELFWTSSFSCANCSSTAFRHPLAPLLWRELCRWLERRLSISPSTRALSS